MILLAPGPSSISSSTYSLVEMLVDVCVLHERCTATAAFWAQFPTFPPVRDHIPSSHPSNHTPLKYSQMDSWKNKATSTVDFQTPTPIPMTMTTRPTAILRMHLARERTRTRGSPKKAATGTLSRELTMRSSCKHANQLSPIVCRQGLCQWRQMCLMMTLREWARLPSSAIRELLRAFGAASHFRNSLADHSFEALLYFLYTDETKFAPFSSDPRHELPPQARPGDWSTGKPPSPSAKSIYRLADKVPAFVWLIPLSHRL